MRTATTTTITAAAAAITITIQSTEIRLRLGTSKVTTGEVLQGMENRNAVLL
jgi:hypothetical protein